MTTYSIGVSILAMPFCFKQCGVILATIMLILSGMLVKVACHLLLKSALLARRRTMENLAFHTHGHTGKLLVELGIIGYLAGTAIAFFVVMGDLGPPMVSKLAGIESTANLRMVVLTGLGLFVALPLSLLRDLESLQYICTTSILFYVFVVARVVLQATPHITSGEWMSEVNLWRPAGMLQCFPIFSLALSCQTNIFAVYTALPDATPAKMNDVVKGAVNLCSGIYITIGFFGYVAFCYVDFAGNILTAFPPSLLIDVIRCSSRDLVSRFTFTYVQAWLLRLCGSFLPSCPFSLQDIHPQLDLQVCLFNMHSQDLQCCSCCPDAFLEHNVQANLPRDWLNGTG